MTAFNGNRDTTICSSLLLDDILDNLLLYLWEGVLYILNHICSFQNYSYTFPSRTIVSWKDV